MRAFVRASHSRHLISNSDGLFLQNAARIRFLKPKIAPVFHQILLNPVAAEGI